MHIARGTQEVNGYSSGQTRAESRQSSVGEHPVCTFTEAVSCAFTYTCVTLLMAIRADPDQVLLHGHI